MQWEGGEYATLPTWLEAPEQGGGVILQATDDPLTLADTIDRTGLVAVDFGKLNDGREFTIYKIFYDLDRLRETLARHDFAAETGTTERFFWWAGGVRKS